MPEKKRQHYVPKFLLKKFSIKGNNKQINIYNISNYKIVKSASLKEQASESYFYGKNGTIEDTLGKIEYLAAKVLNEIVDGKLPLHGKQGHLIILLFTLTLGVRTLYKSEELNELVTKLIKYSSSIDPNFSKNLENVKSSIESPVLLFLNAVVTSFYLATDLKYKLIVNKTSTQFIISDNPVVHYNNFLEVRKIEGSNTGITAKGLQIFLPISPKHVLIFYDQAVYKVNGARRDLFEINNNEDIFSINGLQFLNANNNVYFNESFSVDDITSLEACYKKYRRNSKSNVAKYEVHNSKKNFLEEVLRLSAQDMRCKINLSFIKTLKKAKKYEMGSKLVQYRDENIVKYHNEFIGLVKQNKYKPTDFVAFLMDKLGHYKLFIK